MSSISARQRDAALLKELEAFTGRLDDRDDPRPMQSGNAAFVEIRLGLIVGRPRIPYSSETSVTDAFSTEARRSISYFTCTMSPGSKKPPS